MNMIKENMQLTLNRNKMKTPISDKIYIAIIWIFLSILMLIILFPMLNMFALGFSNGVFNAKVVILPKGFNLNSFNYIFKEHEFTVAFVNSIIITISITVLSTLCMALLAYPMSIQDFPFKKTLMIIFIIPMLFSAGIVPSYLLVKALGMLNTLTPLIVLSIFNTFNMLLMKTYFENLPESVIEAAKIDGSSEFQLLFSIIIPMSIPVIATTAFFTIFGAWNNYGGAMIFCQTNANAQPLAYYIYKLLGASDVGITDQFKILNKLNIQSAAIIISMIPVLIVYPFIMKNLKEGLVIGSDK